MKEKHAKKFDKTIIIQILIFLILIYSLYKIGVWFWENYKTQNILSNIENYITEEIVSENIDGIVEEKTKLVVDFESLKFMNEDTVGYLKVNNTLVEYPVVQKENNEYYLYTSFDKTYSDAGWIFADYKNTLDGTDKNIVIYGHNREDNSMFGSLNNTLKEEWYTNEENQIISFLTPDGYYEYKIFSIYTIANEEYYITTKFSGNEYNEFIRTVKDRSIYNFNIDVTESDNILTLSTCHSGTAERLVVHAKLLK